MIKNIVKIFLIFACVLVMVNIAQCNDRRAEAERLYQAAVQFEEQGKTDLAIASLKNALKLNRKMAKAYHHLALIYLGKNTVYDRLQATYEIEKALRLEPDNLEFRFCQAVLDYEKGLLFNAEKKFQKIVATDPKNYRAWLYLAEMKEQELLHYQHMISIEPNSSGVIYFQEFAEKQMVEAVEYFKQAIAIRPDLPDVYYRLALLYYEFENYPEMVQLLESAVKINPQDKNSRLFLGFAYQHLQMFDLALKEYQMAMKLMTPAERELMESVNLILTPDEQQNYENQSNWGKQHYAANFWKSKEPFFLTEANERMLEHYSRIAYANLRFSRPQQGTEGYQTDMGKVFIRFGKPKSRYRTRPYIGELQDNTRNPLVHSREIWIYPDFEMKFEDEYLSGNYTFARDIRPEFDYQSLFETKIKQQPDYYQLDPDSLRFEVPFEIVAFKGENNKTELEFCYCLPVAQLSPANKKSGGYDLTKGLFLFYPDWRLCQKQTGKLNFDRQQLVEIDGEKYFSCHDRTEVAPGEYQYALEFEDRISKKRSASHQLVSADTFAIPQLQLSDILFASAIELPNFSKNVRRDDFKISPNPLRIYQTGKPVTIYFEIYNLEPDRSGQTHYQIEYSVGTDLTARAGWKKILAQLGLAKPLGEVKTSFSYSSNSTREIHYQQLSLEPNSTGKIRLKVILTDLVSGEKIEKLEMFTQKKPIGQP